MEKIIRYYSSNVLKMMNLVYFVNVSKFDLRHHQNN
jgi:hypothetical protein